jgi:hypothetical protein
VLSRILFASCVVLIFGGSGCFRAENPPAPPPVNIVACAPVAPLVDAPPWLNATASPCPANSVLTKCFDKPNAASLADDIDSLMNDRDYCRGEYGKLVGR